MLKGGEYLTPPFLLLVSTNNVNRTTTKVF